jgi:hypothetical protein
MPPIYRRDASQSKASGSLLKKRTKKLSPLRAFRPPRPNFPAQQNVGPSGNLPQTTTKNAVPLLG